jgi:hypothetical protein
VSTKLERNQAGLNPWDHFPGRIRVDSIAGGVKPKRNDGYTIWRKEEVLLNTKVKAATQCRLKWAAVAKWNSAKARAWPCAN